MPSKRWWLMLSVLVTLSWALPVQAATGGQTEISVGFYATSDDADRIIPERVIPSGHKPYRIKVGTPYHPGNRVAGDGQPIVNGRRLAQQVGMGDRLPQTDERLFFGSVLGGMGLLAGALAVALYQMIRKQQVGGERGA